MKEPSSQTVCECTSDNCAPSSVPRRDFIKLAGLGVVGVGAGALPVMAGPFGAEDTDVSNPIPLDKKLDAAWVNSLFERGEPTTYRGWEELKYIGMPIGGIGSGTVYLGGDGKLWCWDIFNEHHEGCIPNQIKNEPGISPYANVVRERDGSNYVRPTDEQASPWKIDQGFVLTVGGKARSLDRHGFSDIAFCGKYPIATVNYRDDACPVAAELEAFTPFIPLDVERSSYPATVMRYKLTNTSGQPQVANIAGYIENPALRSQANLPNVVRELSPIPGGVAGKAVQRPAETTTREGASEDILFADFEGDDWGEWTAEGKAFAGGPFNRRQLMPVQNSAGFKGEQFVNTYNTRAAEGVNPDDLTGTLTSQTFTVERKFVNFYIAGGKRPNDAYVEVVVDGESVGRATGRGDNVLRLQSIDVTKYGGQEAQIRIVDKARGAWAQIAVDQFVFSDSPVVNEQFEEFPDYGSVALVAATSGATIGGAWEKESQTVNKSVWVGQGTVRNPITEKQIGATEVELRLEPGESKEVAFVVAWHFPNTHFNGRKRWYATQFANASAVVKEIVSELDELIRVTRLWRDTWYGGTLPNWLLERTIVTVDTLQTNNCYQFADGQFWAWEGVGCCPGTCTHVWHYAQAVGRLFPELERDLRERTDFGRGFRESDGRIDFRGGRAGRDATDGQAGVILRTCREHQMSSDHTFLKRVWPKCKKALEFLVAQDARDGEPDGIPVGEQHNTLDAEWFGKVPVLASLYLAALRAGEEMAKQVGDNEAASRYHAIHARGEKNILSIYNEEFGFFVQEEDPNHLDAIGVGDGCYIDQVMGQWWAFNLGLGRLYDGEKIRSALNRLWAYNFCPDMGRLRDSVESPSMRGRPYALAGDAGLVMCTWPKGGRRDDWEKHWQYGYFNECMTGFEYEAAGHMVWESAWEPELLEKGLAVTRAIHDRYHASMRNPYNEIECSDHYARSMASYGVFLAACGFEYNGPAGHIGFAPRVSPDNFSAAFTAAKGWGVYEQNRIDTMLVCKLTLRFGEIALNSFSAAMAGNYAGRTVSRVEVNGKPVDRFTQDGDRVTVTFDSPATLDAGQTLEVKLR